MSSSNHFIELNGLKFHYVVWEQKAHSEAQPKPAIILLHGLRAFARTWEKVAERLSKSYTVFAIDQRGRGQTDWDFDHNYYTDAYVSDLSAFIDAMKLGTVTLLGHSMGGTVSYVYAAENPSRVTKLIIEDIGPESSTKGPGFERIVREMAQTPIRFENMAEAYSYWRNMRPNAPEAAIEQRIEQTMCEQENGSVDWIFDMKGIQKTRVTPDPSRVTHLWDYIEKIAMPTLVLRGGLSDFLPLETCKDTSRRNSLISWKEVAHASHYIHDDNYPDFIRYVEDFLNH